MELGIKGKIALVVGASKNIGRAVALELANEGCVVACAARSGSELRELAQETDFVCRPFPCDLTDPEALAALCDNVRDEIGHPEIIVHAIGGSNGITDTWLPASKWEEVWRLNVGIPHDINRAFLPKMLLKGWGRVVHFSSIATTANIGYSPYNSAKHAVEGYVASVGRQLARHGVIVSCVRPGAFPYPGRYLAELEPQAKQAFIDNFIPQGRFGEAAEAARAAVFLCSDAASYMPGSILTVDGGHR